MGGTLSASSDDGEERTVEAVVSEEGSTSDMFTAKEDKDMHVN